jgi:hypothetical protein
MSMRASAVIGLVFLLPLAASGQQAKQWIIGSWKSNRELTVATLKLKKDVSPELRARLEDVFGRMTVTFRERDLTAFTPAHAEEPEWRFSCAYTVLLATDSKLVYRSQNPQTKKDESTTLSFEGADRYSVPLPEFQGKEYFDRIPSPPKK